MTINGNYALINETPRGQGHIECNRVTENNKQPIKKLDVTDLDLRTFSCSQRFCLWEWVRGVLVCRVPFDKNRVTKIITKTEDRQQRYLFLLLLLDLLYCSTDRRWLNAPVTKLSTIPPYLSYIYRYMFEPTSSKSTSERTASSARLSATLTDDQMIQL